MSAPHSDAMATRAASPSDARRAKLAALTQPVRTGPQTAVFARGVADAADPAEGATLTLANARLRVDLAPALGGALTRFDWRGDGGVPVPLFRPAASSNAGTDPNTLACYPLVPYSNRIGDGRFRFAGRDVEVPRTRPDEPLPIHGDGWLSAWQVERCDATCATLSLERADATPHAYRARLVYALADATLAVTLSVENAGRRPMPFGLGLHPFLVREHDTRLSAAASGLWLSGDDWLPVRHVPAPAAWQFGVAYPLPDTLVNHAFTDWCGRATVVWPNRRVSLTVASNADCYVLYTPRGADFFCFEPVDHPINAVNLPGGAQAHGMTVLAPGERLTREFRFTAEPLGG